MNCDAFHSDDCSMKSFPTLKSSLALFSRAPVPGWLSIVQKIAPDVLRWNWDDAQTDASGAMRMIMGLWRDSRRVQRRFPAPFSSDPGESFHAWIADQIRKRGKNTENALAHIESAFLRNPKEIIVERFVHDYNLRQKHPFGLISEGRIDFTKWLLKRAKKGADWTVEDTLWFLYEAESDESALVEITRALTPEWQMNALYAPVRLRDEISRLNHRSALSEGILVMGHFTFHSGLQRSAMLMVDALRHSGEEVLLRNIPILQGRDMTLRGADFLAEEDGDLSLLHVTPDPYYLDSYRKAGLYERPQRRRIAHYAWELPEPPRGSEPLPNLREIWVHSQFVADSLRSWNIPTYVILPPMPAITKHWQPDALAMRERLGLDRDSFIFLYVFDVSSTLERKNPLAVIKAFQQATRPCDRACLVLKAARGNQYAEKFAPLEQAAKEANVRLLTEMLSYGDTQALISACDCYVSLHRSEGFGFTMAEAMQYSKPVIATAYSGNMDFTNAHNSYLVSWSECEVPSGTLTYPAGSTWADPDVAHAASLMREVLEQRDEARAKGLIGRDDVRRLMDPETITRQIAQRVKAVRSQT